MKMKFFFLKVLFFISFSNNMMSLLYAPVQRQTMFSTQIAEMSQIPGTSHFNKDKAIKQFSCETQNTFLENAKIPQKDNSLVRIMTYNIHFWKSPDKKNDNMKKMIAIIKKINPDILILQEVSPHTIGCGAFENSQAMTSLKRLGFSDFSACNTIAGSGGWFGNVIASKIKFKNRCRFYFEKQISKKQTRCYATAQLQIASQKKELDVFGTHLESKGKNSIRKAQIEQIVEDIQKDFAHNNSFIAGDFNAARKSSVIKFLEKNGFKDCFSYMNWKHPLYTHWTGQEIDFIFLSPNWNLPLAGCYVYYDSASDHLPIIMDIQLERQN
ncbi:MAG: endonuclease/exonuclease/phosphatase family protein [Candidatus Babeliaceae bacterium]